MKTKDAVIKTEYYKKAQEHANKYSGMKLKKRGGIYFAIAMVFLIILIPLKLSEGSFDGINWVWLISGLFQSLLFLLAIGFAGRGYWLKANYVPAKLFTEVFEEFESKDIIDKEKFFELKKIANYYDTSWKTGYLSDLLMLFLGIVVASNIAFELGTNFIACGLEKAGSICALELVLGAFLGLFLVMYTFGGIFWVNAKIRRIYGPLVDWIEFIKNLNNN